MLGGRKRHPVFLRAYLQEGFTWELQFAWDAHTCAIMADTELSLRVNHTPENL